MKIAILGSTGFVGKVLVHKAVALGYQVKTLARNPEKLVDLRDKVEIIQGDIFNTESVDATLFGSEAVLSTIGPPQRNPGDPLLYEKAMKDIVSIMNKYGIRRYIHIGGALHEGGVNEKWGLGRRLLKFLLSLFSKSILISKQLEWEVLKSSELDWTLVRPPQIVKGKATGKIAADEKNLAGMRVDVDDLTDFMLNQITSREWIRGAPLVATVKR